MHLPQFIEKGHRIQKPDSVLLVLILEIEIRAVTGRLHFRGPYFRVVGAAHCFWKTNQICFLTADGPIVSVAAERYDPLFGVAIFQQDVQPAFEPWARRERPGRIGIGSLVK